MGTEVAKPVAGLPAHLQNIVTPEAFDEFAGGVTSSFPVISYRGRTWRVRKGGEEQVYLNDQQEAIQSLDVVMLKSNPVPSKVYYGAKYTEGDQSPPACWSANGTKPDAGVQTPVNDLCVNCPNNVWGSKISESGAKTRACSDVRRVAVAFKHQLEEFEAGTRKKADIDVLLLRIPPATLNPLKDYVTKVLEPKGVPPYVLITKIGFDTEVAYPKLTFKGLRFLTEVEVGVGMELRDGEDTRRILNESLENQPVDDGEGTTSGASQVPTGTAQPVAEASAKAPSPSTPKLQPVEEELFSVPVEDIAPAPARAATVEQDAAQVPEAAPDVAPPPVLEAAPTPAPAPVATVPPQAPAPVPTAAPEVPLPPVTAPATEDDFNDMLSSILD